MDGNNLRKTSYATEHFPGFIAFTDCTEQQIPRPAVDRERRKMYYSGKNKKHTVKNQITVNSCVNALLHNSIFS